MYSSIDRLAKRLSGSRIWSLFRFGDIQLSGTGPRRLATATGRGASAEVTLSIAGRLMERGHLDEAFRICREILREDAGNAPALLLAAQLSLRVGRRQEALSALRAALSADPTLPAIRFQLAATADRVEAIGHCRIGLVLVPEFAPGWLRLGLLECGADPGRDGREAFRRAETAGIDREILAISSGVASMEAGDTSRATAIFNAALAEQPCFGAARFNLAVLDAAAGNSVKAANGFRLAIAAEPDLAVAYSRLGRQTARHGDVGSAAMSHRRAQTLAPADIRHADDCLFLSLVQRDRGDDGFAAALADWRIRFGAVPDTPHHSNRRDPDRRLRIGYVGSTFDRDSNISYFLEPILRNADRHSFEPVLYGDAPSGPGRCGGSEATYRCTSAMTPAAVADLIREDGIDIAVHLLGRAYNDDRSLSFLAAKPAPVQIALHHCMTTGMDAFDLFVGDPMVVPWKTDEPFVERVFRLPHLFVFEPPADTPPVAPSPLARDRIATLGFSGSAWKLTDETLAMWADVMRRLPDAMLALKLPGLDVPANRSALLGRMAGHGIDTGRIRCSVPLHRLADHLDWYRSVDVVLDSSPYGGGNSVLEALWMGVPAPVLAGGRFVGRMGLSILSTAGLQGWVAPSPSDYAALVADLVADPVGLADIRATLRTRLGCSGLTDGVRYARRLDRLYRAVWRMWCRQSDATRAPEARRHLP